jgi:[protein-PII] uridylyltransferase
MAATASSSREKLKEAATGPGDPLARRKSVVAILQEAHQAARAEAEWILNNTKDGFACVNFLSQSMDFIVSSLHELATTIFYPLNNPSTGEKICVAAVGGYGRGTLAPGSDIDLLFILPYKATPWSESVVETILYALWDLKLKVGHSVRTVDECIREAKSDMTIRTALLEARYLAGDHDLFDRFSERFDQDIVSGSAAEFVAAKLAEREARVSRAGSSRYLVEPNVKDGKGGLRDLNTLFWIAKYVYRIKDSKDLIEAGLFSHEEYQLFRRCEDFLWRVRCHLHFAAGRAEERLSFDIQRVLAERLGYVSHGALSGVERFMKRYFLIAKDVGDLTAIVCASLEARHQKPATGLNRFVGKLRRRDKTVKDFTDFVVENERLTVVDDDVFRRDPVNLLRLFHFADKQNRAIHPHAARLVTQSLHLVDQNLRASKIANDVFIEILTSRNSTEITLRRMNEAGLLGKFVPEFGRVVAMMQFNMYHHYTVDEHLLRSIGVLAQIESGQHAAELPVAHEVMPMIRNRKILYVALFLHDIAKGRPEDHSIAGAKVARKLCPRFGLNEAETETVAWLIEHHLDMSNMAQSRDLSDPATIDSFVNMVQTLERLRMLLVLTVCDIRAVGPGVWNGWKGQLLRTLFWETEIILAGGHSLINREHRVRASQDELRRSLPNWTDDELDTYVVRHNAAYWLKVDLARRIKHAQFLYGAAREMRSLATEVATDKFRGVTELTVSAPDHPRLLAILTGACAAAGANIVDAQIFTTTDGMALDTIFISRAFDEDDDELRRAARVARGIEQALKGEIKIAEAVAARAPQRGSAAKTFSVVPEVVVDNSLSNRFTVIEISGLDRPGLLYELTTAIGKLNLNIASAHIVTFGEKAVDVFYVTDLTGGKVSHLTRQATIRKALLDLFGARDSA